MADAPDRTQVGRPGTGADATPVETAPTMAAITPAPSAPPAAQTAPGTPRPRSPTDRSGKVGDGLRAASLAQLGTVPSDRFELLDELARGGLGRVLRARDPRTHRIVALKEVLEPRPDIVARFAREALVTANLQHPSIVPVYEVGRWGNGDPFYAMKLVAGRTLDELIRDATTIAARVALVPHVIAVADALAYAHGERVIHRDLKPSNVLVGAYGETVVIDWGLAKNLATGEELDSLPAAPPSTPPPGPVAPPSGDDRAGATIAGAVLGTPAYMPPEQARGEPLAEQADVYAIGAILYHVLAGARPYAEARTMEDLMHRVRSQPPRPVAELAPDAPPELIAIVDHAMARTPAARYPTAQELAQDLRRYQAGKLVAAHRYTSRQLLRRWLARNRALAVTVGVALAALIALGAASVWRITAERDEATTQREIAQRERGLAERRFADSLTELARQALHVGQPDRALALLAGAVALHAPMTPTLAVLATEARAAYAGLVAIAPAEASGVTSAQLSRDGTRLYTAVAAGGARAWDLAAGHERWHAAALTRLELSPDDRWLAGVDGSGALVIIAADTGAIVTTWPLDDAERRDQPEALRWSPDSTRVVTLARSGRMVLATVAPTGAAAPPRTLAAHTGVATGVVDSLAFSPDGARFASAGAGGETWIHDAATGDIVARLVDDTAPSALAGLAWIDDERVATGDDHGAVRIWRITTARVEQRLAHPVDVYGLVAGGGTPATWLAVTGSSGVVTLWDVATGALRAQLGGHTGGCDYAVTDGAHLITANEAGQVFAWDPGTGERLAALPSEGSGVGLRALGDRVVVYSAGRTRIFRFATDSALRHVAGHVARIRDVTFAPDGTLWTASNDGTARGVDLATGRARVLGEASGAEPPILDALHKPPPANPRGLRSLTLTPDGARVVTATEDGTIGVWAAATGERLATWTGHTGRVRRVVFTRDGRTAYSIGDHTLRAWDATSGAARGVADLGAVGWDLALVDGERTIATQTEANAIARWRAADLSPVATPPLTTRLRDLSVAGDQLVVSSVSRLFMVGPTGEWVREANFSVPYALAVGPRWIAATSTPGEIGLFDAATLAPVRSWLTEPFALAVRFRPDGALLATASAHRVQLWDPATGSLLAETAELPAHLSALAWSPDGRYLAIAGGAGTTWVWDLAPIAPADLTAFARCVAPWRLEDAALVSAPFDPASCAGVLAR